MANSRKVLLLKLHIKRLFNVTKRVIAIVAPLSPITIETKTNHVSRPVRVFPPLTSGFLKQIWIQFLIGLLVFLRFSDWLE